MVQARGDIVTGTFDGDDIVATLAGAAVHIIWMYNLDAPDRCEIPLMQDSHVTYVEWWDMAMVG